MRIGAPIADFSSGLFMLSGVLAALHARDRHPEGQLVEVAMLEAALNMMCNYIPAVSTLGKTIPRLGRGHAQIVPYQAFMCSDGKYVMVGAFTRAFWHNLCRALGREHWMTDPRFRSNAARFRLSCQRSHPQLRIRAGTKTIEVNVTSIGCLDATGSHRRHLHLHRRVVDRIRMTTQLQIAN